MMTQNKGWFQGSNEGSKGEGLSRFLSGQFLVNNGFLGVGIDADYAVADLWLNSARQDFVNNAPDDNGYNATNGCTTLFIYYLFHQLGYSVNQIVGAAGTTLAAVYKNLTSDPNDPFPLFKRMLGTRFPQCHLAKVDLGELQLASHPSDQHGCPTAVPRGQIDHRAQTRRSEP